MKLAANPGKPPFQARRPDLDDLGMFAKVSRDIPDIRESKLTEEEMRYMAASLQ